MDNKKLFMTIIMISFFTITSEAFSSSDEINSETEFFLAINSKCRSSVHGFRCTFGGKFDATKLQGWKKDPLLQNYYEYTGTLERSSFPEHLVKGLELVKKICVSNTFGGPTWRETITCTENTEQQITFNIKDPEYSHYMGSTFSLICDAAGGTAWLNTNFPKAKWIEAPKTPLFFETRVASKEQYKELSKSIELSMSKVPNGCRRLECNTESDDGFGVGCRK